MDINKMWHIGSHMDTLWKYDYMLHAKMTNQFKKLKTHIYISHKSSLSYRDTGQLVLTEWFSRWSYNYNTICICIAKPLCKINV